MSLNTDAKWLFFGDSYGAVDRFDGTLTDYKALNKGYFTEDTIEGISFSTGNVSSWIDKCAEKLGVKDFENLAIAGTGFVAPSVPKTYNKLPTGELCFTKDGENYYYVDEND